MMTGKTILLIDDHPDSCDTLKQMIERRNGVGVCAHGLKQGIAIERLAREGGNPFDAVVCDAGLPNTTIETVLHALMGFLSFGIPVRIITGTSDPDILTACQNAGIPVILKATHAEGIMESILYALAEHADVDPHDVAVAVLENRDKVREVPKHTSWFFARWPIWVQAMVTFGSIFSVCAALGSAALAAVKVIDGKAIAREAAANATKAYKEIADQTAAKVESNIRRLRDVEDRQTKLEAIVYTLPRIEDKLDKALAMEAEDHSKTEAMWMQRMEGKSNVDVKREGVIDTLDGPAHGPTPH